MRSLAPMFGVTVRTPPVGAVYTKNKMARMVRYHFGSSFARELFREWRKGQTLHKRRRKHKSRSGAIVYQHQIISHSQWYQITPGHFDVAVRLLEIP